MLQLAAIILAALASSPVTASPVLDIHIQKEQPKLAATYNNMQNTPVKSFGGHVMFQDICWLICASYELQCPESWVCFKLEILFSFFMSFLETKEANVFAFSFAPATRIRNSSVIAGLAATPRAITRFLRLAAAVAKKNSPKSQLLTIACLTPQPKSSVRPAG